MIKDIEKLLDFKLSLSFPVNEFISLFFGKEGPVPTNLYLKDEETWIDLFLREVSKEKDTPLIESLNPIYLDGLTVVSERLSAPGFLYMYRDLISLSSVVPGGLFLKDKRAYVGFRFHRKDKNSILSILQDSISKLKGIKIDYMGPTDGVISELTSIDSRIPLAIVNYSFNDSALQSNGEKNVNHIVECKLAPRKYNKYGHLRYGGPIGKGDIAYPICEKPEIYATESVSPETNSLLSLLERDRIALGAFFEEYKEGRVHVTVVLPQLLLNSFMNRLQFVFPKSPESTLDITLLAHYSEDLLAKL